MAAVTCAVTALVVIVNVALVAPAATVTLAGTVTWVLELDSVTFAPPLGAGPFNVTVAVSLSPPTTDVPAANALSAGGLTVTVVDCVTPEPFAIMVAVVVAATAVVLMPKFADDAPVLT